DYIEGFMQAMVDAGKTLDAYKAVPDAREAFRFLAADLQSTLRAEDLRELLQIHGKKHTGDPLLPWYQAELYVLDQDYALADKAFAAAMAKPPEPSILNQFRPSRVLARYHAGQALAAHADIGPQHETFQQLANLAFQDRDFTLLQSLLAAH